MTNMHNFTAGATANRQTLALSNETLRRQAPSVFAATPWGAMKERYKFIPTIEVVEMLRDKGFLPVRAEQSRSRIEGKGDFTKHMIRFRPADLIAGALAVGDEFPEVVLVNSHDGTSAYKFMSGIYRLACSNGLIVQSEDTGSVSVRHTGGSDFHERVIDATYEVMDQAPRTMAAIATWKQIELSGPQRTAFAAAAHELRPNESITDNDLLSTRRAADRETRAGLWTTSNIVQENILRGGLRGSHPETKKRSTTRPIKSVTEDVRINRALWRLTEEMAKLVS
jgi:Domain of unknown function (DUF932)